MSSSLFANESISVIFWILVVALALLSANTLALLLILKPGIFVCNYARRYRKMYKQTSKMSDEEIDRSFPRLWAFNMIDSMSHFVNRGVEHPEEFPWLILRFRITGIVLGVPTAFVTLIFIWLTLTGGLSISN